MSGNNIGNEMREQGSCEPKERTMQDLVMAIKDKSTKADSVAEDIRQSLFGSVPCNGESEEADICMEDILNIVERRLNSLLDTLNIISNKL